MELIHSKFELDMCELSFDLLDPMLREPTKTEYMQELLELGDDYPIDLISCRTGVNQYKDDMLLHPNFGHRIHSVQWFEKAIDIAAYTNASYVGGYFGGLVIQEHTDPKLMDYLISFLIDSMSYLSSIAYTAGLFGLVFEPFSLVPDVKKNIQLNLQILKSLQDRSKISINVAPVTKSHDLDNWIGNSIKPIPLIQIENAEEAKIVNSHLDKCNYDSKFSVNIILNTTPSFDLSASEVSNQLKTTIKEIKDIFKPK